MSRNFELMTQLEVEASVADRLPLDTADRTTGAEVTPFLSSRIRDAAGEEMLRFIQRVFLSANGSAPRQVVLCGVDDVNGSSSVCATAGRTLAANSSRPVCLVDANLRSPRLSGLLGVECKTSFFNPSPSLRELREQCVKLGHNLWLAGPNIFADNSRALLPPHQLKERLTQLHELFEYTLIDAPGTSVCGDAQLLGLLACAVILVIEANGTRRLTARKAKETLDAAGVRLLGTVLHNRSFPIPKGLYERL